MPVKMRFRFMLKMVLSVGELTDERGPVRHQQMVKTLDPMANVLRKPEWCTELQDRWGKHIPISDKMGIKIQQYTGYQFQCCAQLNPNLNPHNTLFAGSAFTLATLTGWGMAWLLMRERDLQGILCWWIVIFVIATL